MAMHNPPHPGEFIRATYIEPFDLSMRSLAQSLGVTPSTLTRLVSGRSGLSPEMGTAAIEGCRALSRELVSDATQL